MTARLHVIQAGSDPGQHPGLRPAKPGYAPDPRRAVTGAARRLSVGLVNMPFSSSRMPSIQLGLLQAILKQDGIAAKGHYLNLEFGARVGWEVFDRLCMRAGVHLVGDWLFAAAAFGDAAPPPADYLDRFAKGLSGAAAMIGESSDFFMDLREREVPAFLAQCLDAVAWGDYDVVGFTSVFQQHVAAIAMARLIKERFPHVKVVFGGGNVEGEKGEEMVRAIPWIDYAVTGEGDIAFPLLLDRIGDGDLAAVVPGVAHAKKGAVVSGGFAPHCDLESSPRPDYDDFFEAAQRLDVPATVQGDEVLLPFEAARGCWWGEKHHCTFCDFPDESLTFRSKSPARVLSDIDALVGRYGIYALLATDAILHHRYLRDVFGPLAEARKDYNIFYEVKASLGAEELGTLARAGTRALQPGIESLSTRLLDLMDKGGSGIQMVRFLKWARYHKISVTWHVLRGFPGEKAEDYARQLAVMRLIPHLEPPVNAGRIRLKKASPNYNRAAELGIVDIRPTAPYGHVYPAGVDLDKIAFAFDYAAPTTLPDEAHQEEDAYLAAWREAYYGPKRPTLTYERGSDEVKIADRRRPEAPLTCTLRGVAAGVVEACNVSYRTAERVTDRLREERGSAVALSDVEREMEGLVRRGLLLEEDGQYLGLALPVNPYW